MGHRPAVGARALSDREIREEACHRDELPEGHQSLLHASSPTRDGRPALDETVGAPLSRRRPGPIDPLLVPPTDGPRLSAGKRSTLSAVTHRLVSCFVNDHGRTVAAME